MDVSTLIHEHLPGDDPQVPDHYEDLMTQKNRLRSIVVRKRHSPTLSELDEALASLKSAQQIPSKQLADWEMEIMGFVYSADDETTRVERLVDFLEGMRSFAEVRTQASEADLTRWTRQTEEARGIKLISLILSDLALLESGSDEPEGEREWLIWDGLLVKCELLAFIQFVYRPLKRFEIQIHEPFTVNEFVAQHPNASRRELIGLMTSALHQRIQQPLLQFRKNSASDITSAVFEESMLTR